MKCATCNGSGWTNGYCTRRFAKKWEIEVNGRCVETCGSDECAMLCPQCNGKRTVDPLMRSHTKG